MTVPSHHQRAQQKMAAVKARKRRAAARAQKEAEEEARKKEEDVFLKEEATKEDEEAVSAAVAELSPVLHEEKKTDGDVAGGDSATSANSKDEESSNLALKQGKKSASNDSYYNSERDEEEARDKLDDLGNSSRKSKMKKTQQPSFRRRDKGAKKGKRVRIQEDDDTNSTFDSRQEFFASMNKSDAVTHALDQVFDLFNPLGDDMRSLDDESSIRTERTEETEGGVAFIPNIFKTKSRESLLKDMEELFMERLGCAAPTASEVVRDDMPLPSFSFNDDVPEVSGMEKVLGSGTGNKGKVMDATAPATPGAKERVATTAEVLGQSVVTVEETGPGRIIPSPNRHSYAKRIQESSNRFDKEETTPKSPWQEAVEMVESLFDPTPDPKVMRTINAQTNSMKKEFRSDLSFQSVQSSLRDASSVTSSVMSSLRGNHGTTSESTFDSQPTQQSRQIVSNDSEDTKSIRMEGQAEASIYAAPQVEKSDSFFSDQEEVVQNDTIGGTDSTVAPAPSGEASFAQIEKDLEIEDTIEQSLDDLKAVIYHDIAEEEQEVVADDGGNVEHAEDFLEKETGESKAEKIAGGKEEEPEAGQKDPSSIESLAAENIADCESSPIQSGEKRVEAIAPTAMIEKKTRPASGGTKKVNQCKPPSKKKGALRRLSKLVLAPFKRKKSKSTLQNSDEVSELPTPVDSLVDAEDPLNTTADSEAITTMTMASTPQRTPQAQIPLSNPMDPEQSSKAKRDAWKNSKIDNSSNHDISNEEGAIFDMIMTNAAQDNDWNKVVRQEDANGDEKAEADGEKGERNSDNFVVDLKELETSNSVYEDFAELITTSTTPPSFEVDSPKSELANVGQPGYSPKSSSWDSPLDDAFADDIAWEKVGPNDGIFQPVNIQVLTS